MSDATPTVDDYLRQLVKCARALPQKEWQWGTFTRPDGQPIETVEHIYEAQNHSAQQSETAELWGVNYGPDTSVVAYTGNGPNSRAHAQYLAATQPRNLLWVLDQLGDRLEAFKDAVEDTESTLVALAEHLAGHPNPTLLILVEATLIKIRTAVSKAEAT